MPQPNPQQTVIPIAPLSETLPSLAQVPVVQVNCPSTNNLRTDPAGTSPTTRSHLLKMIMENEQQRHGSAMSSISPS